MNASLSIIAAINIPKPGLWTPLPTCWEADAFWNQCVPWVERRDFTAGTRSTLLVNSLQAHRAWRARSYVLSFPALPASAYSFLS